jgi:predicted HicB family RNase H-like nuclease
MEAEYSKNGAGAFMLRVRKYVHESLHAFHVRAHQNERPTCQWVRVRHENWRTSFMLRVRKYVHESLHAFHMRAHKNERPTCQWVRVRHENWRTSFTD